MLNKSVSVGYRVSLRGDDPLIRLLHNAERAGESSGGSIARILRTYFSLLEAAPAPPEKAVGLMCSILQERRLSWVGAAPTRAETLEVIGGSLIGEKSREYMTKVVNDLSDMSLLKLFEAAYQLERNT